MIFDAPNRSARGRHPLRCTVAYHELSSSGSRDVYQLTPEVFRSQIAALQRASTRAGVDLGVTFDDAHRSQIQLAVPVLEQAGLHGLFFVPAAWVGVRPETATWSDLRTLRSQGHAIGSHGHTHALLTLCSPSDLELELTRSRNTLEDKLGCAVEAISMPGGRWSPTVAAGCYAAGYREVYTSDPGTTDPGTTHPRATREVVKANTPGLPIAIVGRLVVRRTMSLDTLSRYASGDRYILARMQLEHRTKQIAKRLIGDVAYQTVWRRLLRASVEDAL